MLGTLILAASLLTLERNGIALEVEAASAAVDPARSVFLSVTVRAPGDVSVKMPDLRSRVRGFSLAEDFEEPPKTGADGRTAYAVNWRLVPEPCAEEYKVAPFVVYASPRLLSSQEDDGRLSFVAGPIRFAPPAAREGAPGDMEVAPKKDLPPLTWSLVLAISAALAAISAALWGLVWAVGYAVRRVREHRKSPIERAWLELGRLLEKGLPGRGRYKDFYVELTMVVRRYVQRKYSVRAPNMTTQEFLRECGAPGSRVGGAPSLARFLESADMVKFAGVEATPEMADGATEAARDYLRADSSSAGEVRR